MLLKKIQILNSFPIIKKLSQLELPVKVTFTLYKNVKKLQELGDSIEKEKLDIINEHAEKDEKGQLVPVLDENGNAIPDRLKILDVEGFQDKMVKLLNADVEVEIEKVSLDAVKDVLKLSLTDMSFIDWLFN